MQERIRGGGEEMNENEMSKAYIADYIRRAREAQAEFEKMSQEQVDLAITLSIWRR